MLNLVNLLASNADNIPVKHYDAYFAVNFVIIVLLFVAALAAVVLVLLQPSNSSGIDALGGSSETFFGKNKGKSIEVKMKKWTWICLGVILVLSVISYLIQSPILWN